VKTTGCAEFVEYFSSETPPEREDKDWESPLERKERRHKEKVDAHREDQKKSIEKYDPHKDLTDAGDPFKTLFVARISYDTTEKKLKREFEVFGSIKRVRMVYDNKGKPRGYAFIEYEHERDLKNAYKQGDGKKIDGRRVMVDVERGRTVEGWLPRRFGGGRGPGRQGKPSKKNEKKMKALQAKEKADRDKEKDNKDKDKDRDRDRDRDRGEKDKDREKEKERPKEKEERPKEKEKEREKAKEKEKEKTKEKEKEKEKGGRDRDRKRERSRSRDRDRKKSRRDED